MSWLKRNYLFILILFLGIFFRYYHYAQFPIAGETADEYAWSFLGASIIQEHQPASWSYFKAYDNYRTKIDNPVGSLKLVQPALDQPPLFSLIPGMFHSLKAHWWQVPSIKLIRFPMLLIGAINLSLFWLVAKKIFNKKWSLVAFLIFASAGSFVFTSRLVISENLLQTWYLLAIYTWLDARLGQKRNLILIGLSLLAILTKVSGVVLPVSLLLTSLLKKDWRLFKTAVIAGGAGVVTYLAYGYLVNWQLFLAVMAEQSHRLIGLATLLNRWFIHPSLVEKMFFDGWLMLGLLAIFVVIVHESKQKSKWLLPFSIFLINISFIALTAEENSFHAWYDYPHYPILALAIAYLFKIIWSSKNYLLVFLTWLILLPGVRTALVALKLYDQLSILDLRLIALAGSLPLVFSFLSHEKLSKLISLALLITVIISAFITISLIDLETYGKVSNFFFFCDGRCV